MPSYTQFFLRPSLFKHALCFLLPAYDKHQDNVLEKAHLIKGKKIFIAHRRCDWLAPHNAIIDMVEALNKHNQVYLHLTDDTTFNHSRVHSVRDVQAALNAFYAHHSMPHDRTLAVEGAIFLEKARYLGQHPQEAFC